MRNETTQPETPKRKPSTEDAGTDCVRSLRSHRQREERTQAKLLIQVVID
jgi:hypothetical protein